MGTRWRERVAVGKTKRKQLRKIARIVLDDETDFEDGTAECCNASPENNVQ
jgi:hypothetical protein